MIIISCLFIHLKLVLHHKSKKIIGDSDVVVGLCTDRGDIELSTH